MSIICVSDARCIVQECVRFGADYWPVQANQLFQLRQSMLIHQRESAAEQHYRCSAALLDYFHFSFGPCCDFGVIDFH